MNKLTKPAIMPNLTNESTDPLDFYLKYEDIFPRGEVETRKFVHVIGNNLISENGDVLREFTVGLLALKTGVDKFVWWIPHVHGEPPFGIELRAGNDLIPFDAKIVRDEREGHEAIGTKLIASIASLKKGQRLTLSIKYYIKAYVKRIGRGIFYTRWRFQWVYSVRSRVDYLEIRAVLPKNAHVELDSVTSSSSRIANVATLNSQPVYSVSLADPPTGNILGQFSFRVRSTALPMTVSLIAALVITLLGNFLTQPVLSLSQFVIATLMITTLIYVAHLLIERL